MDGEADGILTALSTADSTVRQAWAAWNWFFISKFPSMIHLPYTRAEPEAVLRNNPLINAAIPPSVVSGGGGSLFSYGPLVGIWLFICATAIPAKGRQDVRKIVRGKRRAVEKLVAMHGLRHMLPRSDLERQLT